MVVDRQGTEGQPPRLPRLETERIEQAGQERSMLAKRMKKAAKGRNSTRRGGDREKIYRKEI